MLYILDTDHISLLQRGHPTVKERSATVAVADRATTIISLTEQFLGWWNEVIHAKNETEAARNLQYLQAATEFFSNAASLTL